MKIALSGNGFACLRFVSGLRHSHPPPGVPCVVPPGEIPQSSFRLSLFYAIIVKTTSCPRE
jgi:hypothetical protein